MSNWLAEHLSESYTKRDLVQMMVDIYESGEFPLTPDTIPALPKAEVGRPSKEVRAGKVEMLAQAIKKAYPKLVNIKALKDQSGMTSQAIQRLQRNAEFLAKSLGYPYNEYFQSLQLVNHRVMTVGWRVALDLHNYKLMLTYPGVRLPLYRIHTVMFNTPSAITEQTLRTRDAQERRRLTHGVIPQLLTEVGWPLVEPPTVGYTNQRLSCVQGCPVCQAHEAGYDINLISNLRDLVDLPLTWGDQDRTFLESGRYEQVFREVLGI